MTKYLARRSDGAVLKRNDDGTYSFTGDPVKGESPELDKAMSRRRYPRELLSDTSFEEVTEKDFPWLRLRHEEYYAYHSWASRSDGHGGCKGGTIEEFRALQRGKNNGK